MITTIYTRCTHTPGKQQHNYTSWVMDLQLKEHIKEKSTFTPTSMNYMKYKHATEGCTNRFHKKTGINWFYLI
jgi:hypothetical protein